MKASGSTTSVLTTSPMAVGAAVGACAIGLAIWQPGDHGVPLCPTKAMTGLDCPLCGGLRAVATMTRGHLGRAADHNLLVVVIAPFAVAWWIAAVIASRRGTPPPRPRWNNPPWNVAARAAFVVVVIAFTIVRNLRVDGRHNWLASEAQ